MKINTLYIEPASPWQNGYIESFHARFREECLNREQLWTLTEARVVIEGLALALQSCPTPPQPRQYHPTVLR